MEHVLKLWPVYYKAVVAGVKTFEVRENHDRCYQKNDTVTLQEFDPTQTVQVTKDGAQLHSVVGYTKSPDLKFRIGYVMPIDANRVVFSLVPLDTVL